MTSSYCSLEDKGAFVRRGNKKQACNFLRVMSVSLKILTSLSREGSEPGCPLEGDVCFAQESVDDRSPSGFKGDPQQLSLGSWGTLVKRPTLSGPCSFVFLFRYHS